MTDGIIITTDVQYKGNWIKILVPHNWARNSFATIYNNQGNVIRRVHLEEGNNTIDVSQLDQQHISLKVETPYETLLKQFKINQK